MSIQQCPGRVARITFDKECAAAKEALEELGEVTVNGVQCLVLRPEPPPPRLVNVLVYQYPFEFPNNSVATVLDKFGAVKEVGYQRWTSMPTVFTGTRLVRMVVEKEIPRFLFIRGIRCKVWYRDQPLTCDICSKGGHKASACPDKGKCLRCHEAGHVARHCPNPWGNAGNVPPVVVDPSTVVPAGDLSRGLQHAEDLDASRNESVADATSQVQASVSSDNHALAEAASVTEVVIDAFSQADGPSSLQDGSSGSSPGDSVTNPNVPEVVVVEEGDVTTSEHGHIVLDDRFNQLDELESQFSQSILTNCGPGVVSSGGEFVKSNQINNNCNNNDSVSNLSNSNIDSESNLSKESSVTDSNVNCYGSVVVPDGTTPGPSNIVDSEMTQASDPRKRTISEVSSDDAIEEFSSSSSVVPESLCLSKKGSKKSANAAGHLPSGLASAACLAVAQVLARK